jgi:hypothetical protein
MWSVKRDSTRLGFQHPTRMSFPLPMIFNRLNAKNLAV